jgi:hypothetical protein
LIELVEKLIFETETGNDVPSLLNLRPLKT